VSFRLAVKFVALNGPVCVTCMQSRSTEVGKSIDVSYVENIQVTYWHN